MNVKRDWVVVFDEEQVRAAQGPSFARLLQDPKRRTAWHTALAEARQLVQPAAIWDCFAVQAIVHEKLVLANGRRFGSGPLTTVVGGASELVVGVCTAGKAISDRISAYQQDRRLFEAMMLSELGTWAVDSVRQQLCHLVEEEASASGLRVSTPMSPGESAWSVEDQAVIFQLVDGAQIGVSLTEQMVMYPLKSLSVVIGIGSHPMGEEGADSCMYCAMKERCNYRHHRPQAAALKE